MEQKNEWNGMGMNKETRVQERRETLLRHFEMVLIIEIGKYSQWFSSTEISPWPMATLAKNRSVNNFLRGGN